MAGYSVHVEIRRHAGDEYWDVPADAADAAMDRLAEWSGVVACAPEYWSATVTVEAADAGEAAITGRDIVGHEGSAAGLPHGDVTRAEAIRDDVLDEDLGLVSSPVAAQILGVSVQRFHTLVDEHPVSLRPAYKSAAVTLHKRVTIERFNETWDRKPGRPRKGRQGAA